MKPIECENVFIYSLFIMLIKKTFLCVVMIMNTRTTIRDVAKEANVSIATVSKALNGVDVVKSIDEKAKGHSSCEEPSLCA